MQHVRWRALFDILYFFSAATLIVGLLLHGLLPWWLGTAMLMAAIFFRAWSRIQGGVADWVYTIFRVGFYGILILWAALYGGIAQVPYILLGAMFTGFERLLVEIFRQATEGALPIWLALGSVLGLILLRELGLKWGGYILYWLIYRIIAPLFVFLIMIAKWGNGDWDQIVFAGGSVLIVFLMAEAAYLFLLLLLPQRGIHR